MTIERGRSWGEVVLVPEGLVTVNSNAELHDLINDARRRGGAMPPVGLLGGDLGRTLACPTDPARFAVGAALQRLPVDLGLATFGTRAVAFAAHAIIRRRSGWRWRGAMTAAMNAEFVGPWDVAPRGHPNDGKLDILAIDATFGPRQRYQASRRLLLGTHVPHPGIRQQQTARYRAEFDDSMILVLDGVDYGGLSRVELSVLPDALWVFI